MPIEKEDYNERKSISSVNLTKIMTSIDLIFHFPRNKTFFCFWKLKVAWFWLLETLGMIFLNCMKNDYEHTWKPSLEIINHDQECDKRDDLTSKRIGSKTTQSNELIRVLIETLSQKL